jgi:hypothetical protein
MSDESTEHLSTAERLAAMRKPLIQLDEETLHEQAEHSRGFDAFRSRQPKDKLKSPAWQRGYDDAQSLLPNQT